MGLSLERVRVQTAGWRGRDIHHRFDRAQIHTPDHEQSRQDQINRINILTGLDFFLWLTKLRFRCNQSLTFYLARLGYGVTSGVGVVHRFQPMA